MQQPLVGKASITIVPSVAHSRGAARKPLGNRGTSNNPHLLSAIYL
jgi:hypothetical protein